MTQSALNTAPLISNNFVIRVTAVATVLAALTVGISVAGKWYGRVMVSGQFSTSDAPKDIFIGPDHLRLAENVIRFPSQRVTGEAEQVNLALQWPNMSGYSPDNAAAFVDPANDSQLLFIELSQATMSRDMSGRVEPIYARLFSDSDSTGRVVGPAGLTLRHFKSGSGYGDEVMLTDPKGGEAPYAVRCILPASPAAATSADCQRDIHVGQDLNVDYRFSSQLLDHWKDLDAAVLNYVASHIVP